MSSSISTALTTALSANTTPAPQLEILQPLSVQQQLAEASLVGIYGPPYILDVSLAYAVGTTPLSGSNPAPAASPAPAINLIA